MKGKLNTRLTINSGGFIFIIGLMVNLFLKTIGLVISSVGFMILLIGIVKLKKEKKNGPKEKLPELLDREFNQHKVNSGLKAIIVGIICSLIILGSNWGLSWYQKQELTKQCEQKCCEYSSTHNLWLYKCDTNLCCPAFSTDDDLSDCCVHFETKNSCLDYCVRDLKKTFFPGTPAWLKWF